MFADGSPASGFEAFICIEQMFSNGCFDSRILPVVYLGYGFQSLADKLFAFLWTVFLEIGPFPELIRKRLLRIRGWTTDWGTESGICNTADVLPQFLHAIGYQHPVPQQLYMFPRAVWVPGWHHLWDGVAKDAFASLPWFAEWLVGLKSIDKFFRVSSYRQIMVAAAAKAGFDSKFLKGTPPSFANWRWATLWLVLTWLAPLILLFQELFTWELFKGCKEAANAKQALKTIRGEVWLMQFRIIYDAMELLHSTRTWGSGCACHEDERMAGKVIICPLQGRRLPMALARVGQFQVACAARREIPGPDDACARVVLSDDLEFDRRGLFEYINASGSRKVDFLNDNPYAIARARDPLVMKACRDAFLALPAGLQERDRISAEFFGPDSPIAADVDSFITSLVMSKELEGEIHSVELLPLTEEVVERPHSHMTRERRRQHAASRSWQSATLRLEGNLDLYDGLWSEPAWDDMFQLEWTRVKRLVQTDPGRECTPALVSLERLKETVYRAAVDVPCFPKGMDVKSGVVAPTSFHSTVGDQMREEFLRAVFVPHCFYTFGDECTELRCFQIVIIVAPSKKFVDTGKQVHKSIDLAVQWYDFFKPPSPELDLGGVNLEVFAFEAVTIVDGLKLADWNVMRSTLRCWKHDKSDISGCVRLSLGRLSDPTSTTSLGLADPGIPLLCLLEELKRLGWEISSTSLPARILTSDVPARFSAAMWSSKCKPYFQCLAFLPTLFSKGLMQLDHGQPGSFYRLILQSDKPGDIKPGEKAVTYMEALASLGPLKSMVAFDVEGLVFSDDDVDVGDVTVRPCAKAKARIGGAVAMADVVFSDHEDEQSGDEESPDSQSSSDSSSSDDGVVRDLAPPLVSLPNEVVVGDYTITTDVHYSKVSRDKDYKRYIIKCRLHKNCTKKRGMGSRQTGTLGEFEPLAFLVAWASSASSFTRKAEHGKHRPSSMDVQGALASVCFSLG
jgi:hypothetical protein